MDSLLEVQPIKDLFYGYSAIRFGLILKKSGVVDKFLTGLAPLEIQLSTIIEGSLGGESPMAYFIEFRCLVDKFLTGLVIYVYLCII